MTASDSGVWAEGSDRLPKVNGIPLRMLDELSGVRAAQVRDAQRTWVEYYGQVNDAVHALHRERAADPYNPAGEQTAQSRVLELLAKRETLEKETFMLGLLPTPICRDGYVVNLEFANPLSLKARKRGAVRSISSSFRIV